MRLTTIALTAMIFFAVLPAHAVPMPTQEQIHAAVQAAVVQLRSPVPIGVKVTSLLGCQESQEVKGEVVCLVGMSVGMRDGFKVLPLRLEGATWVGVERKDARFAGPAPAEAQAMLRAWAAQEAAANPAAAQDAQMREAQTTIQVTALNHCEMQRKTGYLECDAVLSVPSRPDDIQTRFTFALEGAGWRYVLR